MSDDDTRRDIDVTNLSLSGSYNYITGGTDNTLTDREIVLAYERKWPGLASNAVENAKFLQRAVRMLAEDGVCQFIDLGAGRPKPDAGTNTHEVVAAVNSECRVVYVEKDPTGHSHARAIWGAQPSTAYIEADIRDADLVLSHPETRRLIDFDEPVALLLASVLHYVGEAPATVAAPYAAAVPPGSFLVVAHMLSDGAPAELLEDLKQLFANVGGIWTRPQIEIEGTFQGWPLEEPGLVDVRDWRQSEPVEPGPVGLVAGVARKPS